MNFRDWPAERIQQFRDLWADGLTVHELKLEMHVTESTVLSARRYYELPVRHAGTPHRRPKAKARYAAVLPCPDTPGWPRMKDLMSGK